MIANVQAQRVRRARVPNPSTRARSSDPCDFHKSVEKNKLGPI